MAWEFKQINHCCHAFFHCVFTKPEVAIQTGQGRKEEVMTMGYNPDPCTNISHDKEEFLKGILHSLTHNWLTPQISGLAMVDSSDSPRHHRQFTSGTPSAAFQHSAHSVHQSTGKLISQR